MKTWIILALASVMTGCGSTGKNQSASQIPASMECPSSQDAGQGCPSPSNSAIPLDAQNSAIPSRADNKAEAAGRMKTHMQSIEGRCELLVRGEKTPRSCSEVKVMVRSLEKGEMRDGVVDGFAIAFTDLNEKSYKALAQSEVYELTTTGAELKPGKKILLKIKAKPRKR